MKLSIVTTLYRSEKHISTFYERMVEAASRLTTSFEIVVVNDGSPDNSIDVIRSIAENDYRVTVVNLSRNFGHHKAMMAGLEHTTGEYVFLIDCDLEEEPELIQQFWKELDANRQLDVIYGVQEKRKGGLFEQISGNIFYTLFNFLSNVKLPRNFTTCRLMKRRYVDALVSFRETDFAIGGLWVLTGFEQKQFAIHKHSKGQSTYNLTKKISLMVDSIVSFSDYPLNLIFRLGIFISILSLCYILVLVYQVVFLGYGTVGWPSLIVSIWFLGGLQIMVIGVVGKYVAKIFIETKHRPRTIVKEIIRSSDWLGKS